MYKMDLFDDEEKVQLPKMKVKNMQMKKKHYLNQSLQKLIKREQIHYLINFLINILKKILLQILIKKKEEEFQFLDKNLIKKIRKTNVAK